MAERDFTAEKGEVIVISTGAAVDAKAEASSERERKAAEERNRHRCRRLCDVAMINMAATPATPERLPY